VITGAGDIPLLRMVRNCRFVSHQQLFDLLRHDAAESSRGSFNWRMQRLLRAGRVDRVKDVFWDGSAVYTVNQKGLLELESHHEFAIALHSRTHQMPDRAQVFHALELNAIRLSLVRRSLLVSWQSEVEITSENLVSTAPYQKDYDAIVKVWLGNEIREFAVEYEHSLKSAKQYEKIRAALEAERRVGCILYLAVNQNLMSAILYQLAPVSTRTGFLTSRTFRELLLKASVTTGNDRAMVTLEEFLQYSHPLYIGSWAAS